MFNPFDSEQVLIEAPPVRGRSALIDRKEREYAPTVAPPTEPMHYMPPLPVITWQDSPRPIPEPLPSWPLMTRVRLRIAAWLIGI